MLWKSLAFGLMMIVSRGVVAGECDAALVISTYSESNSFHDDWRLASLVTEDNYNEVKRGAGVQAIIYGIPIGANYSDFSANRAKSASGQNESRTVDAARNIAWTGLDPNGLSAYRQCLDTQVFQRNGLQAAVISATQNDVVILVRWFVPGRNEPAKVSWQPTAIGGQTLAEDIPQGLTQIRVPRPTSQVTLIVNFQGLTTSPPIVLEPFLPPPTRLPQPAADTCETYRDGNGYCVFQDPTWPSGGKLERINYGAGQTGYSYTPQSAADEFCHRKKFVGAAMMSQTRVPGESIDLYNDQVTYSPFRDVFSVIKCKG